MTVCGVRLELRFVSRRAFAAFPLFGSGLAVGLAAYFGAIGAAMGGLLLATAFVCRRKLKSVYA